MPRQTSAQRRKDVADAKTILADLLTQTTRLLIFQTYRRAASTGQTRRYNVYIAIRDPNPLEQGLLRITPYVGRACGFRLTKNGEISLGGCGYSGAQEIATRAAQALHGRDSKPLPYQEL